MGSDPLTVAVCIPTIPPRAELLQRALRSVEVQTRLPDEVVVIEDERGAGAATTRNVAWREASTDYVAFLDDDDELLPQHLEVLMAAAEHSRVDLYYSWFEIEGAWPGHDFYEDPLATMYNGHLVHPLGIPFGEEQARHLRKYAFIPTTTVVRKVTLGLSGGFPEPQPPYLNEEHGAWNRLLDVGAKFEHVPQRTWIYHFYKDRKYSGGKPWRSS